MLDRVPLPLDLRLSCLGSVVVLCGLQKHAETAAGELGVCGLGRERRADFLIARPVSARDVQPRELSDDPFRQLACRYGRVGPDDIGNDATEVAARQAEELSADNPTLGRADDRVGDPGWETPTRLV